MSLANKLTVFRIILIPVFLIVLYLPFPYMRAVGAVLFFIAAMTDILDGYVARKQKTVSDFGKIMDPIADKLLVIAGLLMMVQWGEVGAWAAIVIVSREILISGLRLVVLSRGGQVIAASWLGKTKTILQDIAVICLLLQKNFLFLENWYICSALLLAALVFTVWSGVDYAVASARAVKEADAR
ncbi:MAG: CDP-diacylglycerol--glycerol-3-phosphate 3-phosphatidyltransferase [Eubacteriales bacterium]|nr:CDP-diacylglycerol--glycerol-3-phosphate 3-phosphatidyltransferase [Eubacteriales bacterium]